MRIGNLYSIFLIILGLTISTKAYSNEEEQDMKMMDVSWDSYYKTAEKLIKQISGSGWEFDHIVCIARGGMPLGDMLSRVYKKPLAVIVASSYRGEGGMQQKQLVLSDIAKISDLGKHVLLIDDLVDSGKTLDQIKSLILAKYEGVEEVRTAVLWYKSYSEFMPNYVSESVDGDIWIKQPFERYDFVSADDL